MKKFFKTLVATSLVLGAVNANAAIGRDAESELAISIIDRTAEKSYFKDTGVALTDFLANPQSLLVDFSNDPFYADFKGKSGLEFGVYAANIPSFLATSNAGFAAAEAWSGIGTALNASTGINSYIGKLNSKAEQNKAGGIIKLETSENLSGVCVKGEICYHDDPFFTSSADGNFNFDSDGEGPLTLFTGTQVGRSQIVTEIGTINFDPNGVVSTSTSPIPVPAAVWMFGTGLLGLLGYRRRKA